MTTEVDRDGAALARALRDVTVRVVDAGERGMGSGVVWDGDGTIVTNAHVVRGTHARVLWDDDRSARATVVRRDDARDLALLRVGDGGVRRAVADVRSSRSLRPGELVVAVGNPGGLTGAYTAGLVRGCNARWVMSSVRLAPGNSGGPLADGAGRVVGINAMVAGDLGLAIPSDAVAAFVADARAPRLGIAVARAVATLAGTRVPALVVTGVEAASAAAASGIALGDAILAVDGVALARIDDVVRALGSARTVTVARGGERTTIVLERPRGTRAA